MTNHPETQGITAAEWRIMRLLWERSPLGSQEIIRHLASSESWAPTTVKTLLSRLTKKGIVGYQEKNRQYEYVPLVDEASCTRKETRSLIDRVFAGVEGQMITRFVEEADLSTNELEALRELLDRKIQQSKG